MKWLRFAVNTAPGWSGGKPTTASRHGQSLFVSKSTHTDQRKVIAELSFNALKSLSDKPPILMAHGLLGNKNNFSAIAKKLAKDCERTVVTYDARNHGLSPHYEDMTLQDMSEDAIGLMDLLNIEECVLIGHSMGGRMAMHTALTYPDRVSKLVIVDSSPRISKYSGNAASTLKYVKAMKKVTFRKTGALSSVRSDVDRQLQKRVPEAAVRNFILTNIIQSEDGFCWRLNLDAICKHVESLDHIELKKNMPPFEKESLFLGGGSSQFIKYEDFPHIKKLFPKSIISFIPDCGHWVHSEKPVEFHTSILSFLKPSLHPLFDENAFSL